MRLAERIVAEKVPEGQIGLFSLGQAGFIFKTPDGKLLAVDPYLSDAAEREVGFKRMIPCLIAAEDLKCDLVITTHEHIDHYDLDAVPVIARSCDAVFAGPPECHGLWLSQGLPDDRFACIQRNQTYSIRGFEFSTTHADHADLSPNCLGLLLSFPGFKVYISSDTAYRPDLIPGVIAEKPEVFIPVINGRYGNMNSIEAAQLVRDVGAKVTIPSHFWMFIEHESNPQAFVMACKLYAPASQCYVMAPGEFVLLPNPERVVACSQLS